MNAMVTLSLVMLFKRNYEKETEDLKDENRLTVGVEFTSDCSPLNHMNQVCPIEKATIFHSDRYSIAIVRFSMVLIYCMTSSYKRCQLWCQAKLPDDFLIPDASIDKLPLQMRQSKGPSSSYSSKGNEADVIAEECYDNCHLKEF